MSGPKVVRIVTREELQAIGRADLRKTENAIESLVKIAKRHDEYSDALAKELANRHAALVALFEKDEWRELKSQSAMLAGFLNGEKDRIRLHAISNAKLTRSKRSHMRDAALSMISLYEAAGIKAPADLHHTVSTVELADEKDLALFQTMLNAAFKGLNSATKETCSSDKQSELAAMMGAGEKGMSFPEWLASNPQETIRSEDARLTSLMAEIEALDDAETVRQFMGLTHAIDMETSTNRRALLTDSLALELGAHCRLRREKEEVVAMLGDIRSSLLGFESQVAGKFADRVALEMVNFNLDRGKALLAEAKSALESETKAFEATARRRAILEGLSNLGYEVKEQMATAWVKDGRIVVSKPGSTDYGVEIGAPMDASKMQVRLVGSDRPTSPRDTRRDADMETIWCSEFTEMKARLAEAGTDVVIERALGVGVQPVKTISFAADQSREQENTKAPKISRTLPGP
jgi:hypothetical protein